jgi:hypothetical protein
MMAEVGVSISGMPGPPLGPSYRMTTTLPCTGQGWGRLVETRVQETLKQQAPLSFHAITLVNQAPPPSTPPVSSTP